MSRAFNAAALASALLLGVTLILFLSAFRRSSHEPLFSLSQHFHVTVTDGFRHEPDARVAFFSDPIGPYRGSIISLGDGDGIVKSGFGDSWGVYYRHFRWPTGEVLWTLMVTLWYPIALLSILPAIWAWRRFRMDAVVPPEATNSG